jgi:PhnB protein
MPARRKRRKRAGTTKVSPVLPGFHTVTPYLAISGASEAIEFYKKAFGAKELARRRLTER